MLSVAVHVITFSTLIFPVANRAQQLDHAVPQGVDTAFIDRIHQGDIVDIHVSGYLEFDWRGSITPEGFLDGYERISRPIFAQCKTEHELAQELDGLLSEILREPKTEVRILDRSKRPFAIIDGAVKTPQRMQMRRSAWLSEIIVTSGGLTDRASGKIIISRPSGANCVEGIRNERTARLDIDLTEMLAGAPDSNPIIVSGDLIVVIEASPVFLLGAVRSEGRIDYRAELSVSRAIDAAGGLLKNAVPQQVQVFRRDGGATVFRVDIEKVRAKKTDDVVLRPFDIIDVPFKGKPPRRLPPMIETDAEDKVRRARLPLKIIG